MGQAVTKDTLRRGHLAVARLSGLPADRCGGHRSGAVA